LDRPAAVYRELSRRTRARRRPHCPMDNDTVDTLRAACWLF